MIPSLVPQTPTLKFLNFLNNKLEEVILKCAKRTIPTKIRQEEGFNTLRPKELVLAKRYLSKCNRINRLLNKKNKHHVIDHPNHVQWNKWLAVLPQIYHFLDLKPSQWPRTVRIPNLAICRSNLDKITCLLIKKTRLANTHYDLAQINFYSERRCSDLKSNQSKMIDGLLERTQRKIKLDRVMLDDGTLTTDEQEIADKVNHHFQTAALPIMDPPDEIPDE